MYRVETGGEDIDASIEALPPEFLPAFAELRAALEVAPWTVGRPYVATNPAGSRTASFGPQERGMLLYVVQEHDRVVAIWQVALWPSH